MTNSEAIEWLKWLKKPHTESWICDALDMAIEALSSDAVDCTDFIEWLVDRVLDETIWEYNSVAYGEIICRKLEKLGVLEVTEEPSYYIRPSADAVQGEWLDGWEVIRELSETRCMYNCFDENDRPMYEAMTSAIDIVRQMMCGARMKGGDNE